MVDCTGACFAMRMLLLLFEDALLVVRLEMGLVLFVLLLLTLTTATALPSEESEKTPLDSVSVDVTISSAASLFPLITGLAAACLIVSWFWCWWWLFPVAALFAFALTRLPSCFTLCQFSFGLPDDAAAAAALLFLFMLLLLDVSLTLLPAEPVSPSVVEAAAAAFELASFLSFRFVARILRSFPILMGFLATTTAALAVFTLAIGGVPLLLLLCLFTITTATVRIFNRLDIFTHCYCSLAFVRFSFNDDEDKKTTGAILIHSRTHANNILLPHSAHKLCYSF